MFVMFVCDPRNVCDIKEIPSSCDFRCSQEVVITNSNSNLIDTHDFLPPQGEGVAYRGRALVQLTTTLGELPEAPIDEIGGDDRLRVQKFMRRRKYRVHAAFLNASMISSSHVDAPIEFEVSIG